MNRSSEGPQALQTQTDTSVLAKRDTKVIAVTTAKDAGATLDFEGELSAVQRRMEEALDSGATSITLAEPRALALDDLEISVLPPLERSLYDAKQMIAREEYSQALVLLDEILLSEPEEDSRVIPMAAESPNDPPRHVEEPLWETSPDTTGLAGSEVEGVAAGRGWARRNDPCPCGSGKKYKRCHGA